MRNVTMRKQPRSWLWLRQARWIFLVAFILRIGVAGVFIAHNELSWGVNEPANIAQAIVQGRGFSSAFHDASGATAWLAPVYPFLLASIFRFFGVKTAISAVMAILCNVIFSSLTAVVAEKLGREQFGENAGAIAGWAWATAPPLLFVPWLQWETCLSGLVLGFVFMTTLRLDEASETREWVWCGAVWSFAALLNPAILAPLAVLAIEAGAHARRWKGPALMIFVCVLGILPWTARNYAVFRQFVPVRSNFWAEAYFGNVGFSLHPTGNTMVYQQVGEIAFTRELRTRTLEFVRAEPKRFGRLTAERFVAFWTQPPQLRPYPLALFLMSVAGIVRAGRQKKRWAEFASVLLLYPLIYYFTYTFARYRYPVEPLMYTLAAYLVASLFTKKNRAEQSKKSAATLLQ